MDVGYRLGYVSNREYARYCMKRYEGIMFASKSKLKKISKTIRKTWVLGNWSQDEENHTEYCFNSKGYFATIRRGLTKIRKLPKRTPEFVEFVSKKGDDLEDLVKGYGLSYNKLQVKVSFLIHLSSDKPSYKSLFKFPNL